MWARKAKRLRSFDAYDQAVDRAALALLAALRDHANPQFSSVQLEALRLRGVGEGAQGHGRKDSADSFSAYVRKLSMFHVKPLIFQPLARRSIPQPFACDRRRSDL